MALSSRAYELLQAFDQPGCPICRLTADSVHHYLEALMYEYVNEVPTHMAVRAARGFCPISRLAYPGTDQRQRPGDRDPVRRAGA